MAVPPGDAGREGDMNKTADREQIRQCAARLFPGDALTDEQIEPKFREVEISDPIAYVLSLNLHRRHLNPSQWAMVGERARDYYDKRAKERQKPKPAGKSVVDNCSQQNTDTGKARDHVAKTVGVSGK